MNRKRIKALFGFLKGYKFLLLISLLLMVAELLLNFVTPQFLSVTFDSILNIEDTVLDTGDSVLDPDDTILSTEDIEPKSSVPNYIMWFIDAVGGVEHIRSNLWIMALAMIGLQALRGLLTFSRSFTTSKASEGTIKRLRDRLYSHVQNLPFKYHVSAQTGD
ncbi:MAG: ABC transporter ATP-binding protein, partial [Clostridiales bacterium]|nr:ABC transporter ATP-binding protein [Clostridiales bacterium]